MKIENLMFRLNGVFIIIYSRRGKGDFGLSFIIFRLLIFVNYLFFFWGEGEKKVYV